MGTAFWKLFHAGLEVNVFMHEMCGSRAASGFVWGEEHAHVVAAAIVFSLLYFLCCLPLVPLLHSIRNEVVLGEAECSGFRKLFGGNGR